MNFTLYFITYGTAFASFPVPEPRIGPDSWFKTGRNKTGAITDCKIQTAMTPAHSQKFHDTPEAGLKPESPGTLHPIIMEKYTASAIFPSNGIDGIHIEVDIGQIHEFRIPEPVLDGFHAPALEQDIDVPDIIDDRDQGR
jgi:hypothetical protein